MNCQLHRDVAATARCTRCGVLLCALCRTERGGRACCTGCAGGPRGLKILLAPVPPAMPVVVAQSPTHLPVRLCPPRTPTPPAARRPRPAVAGALGAVPGLGHVYAGRKGRGLLVLAAAGAVIPLTATGLLPFALYAFLHGLVAWDGYRCARVANGLWSAEDSREARGVWIATAGALVLLGLAHAAGAPFSPRLVWPAMLIPLGVGVALGAREPRHRCERPAAAAPAAPPAPPAAPSQPAPGVAIDRRGDRAALAAQLVS